MAINKLNPIPSSSYLKANQDQLLEIESHIGNFLPDLKVIIVSANNNAGGSFSMSKNYHFVADIRSQGFEIKIQPKKAANKSKCVSKVVFNAKVISKSAVKSALNSSAQDGHIYYVTP